MRAMPKRRATQSAAALAQVRPSPETPGARATLPLSQAKPASVQPMVPLRSATTLLGTPALISDCAPMMLRVRPAQFTTTIVSGEGARSRMRSTSSAPGTLTALGMETRWYSSNGRLSSTTTSLCSSMSRCRSCAQLLAVPAASSANPADPLPGTINPGNRPDPSLVPPPTPAVERKEIGVAGAREDLRGALGQAIAVVAQHDARAPPRHQAGEVELEPAQG